MVILVTGMRSSVTLPSLCSRYMLLLAVKTFEVHDKSTCMEFIALCGWSMQVSM